MRSPRTLPRSGGPPRSLAPLLALVPLVPLVALLHCGAGEAPPAGVTFPPVDAAIAPPPDASTTADATTADARAPDATPADAAPLDASDAAVDAADAAVRYLPTFYAVNHVLSTGQSLSVGSQGTPVLSTSQPFDNRMLNTGVLRSATRATSFLPLVEGSVETMSSGLANLVADVAQTEVLFGLPAPNDRHRLLVSCHGIGGTAYVGLKKGTAAFTSGLNQVRDAKTIATAAMESYVVRAVTNVHGESDHVAGNATYAADLAEWQSDYETEVKAITGQTEPIPMFHTQMSSWTKYGQATSAIPLQQLEASIVSNGKIVLVGPKYNVQYAPDGVHLTAAGYRHMGEYYAKVYRRVVLEGRRWEPLRPVSATLTGDEIRVKFVVPVAPLVFDTTTVTDPGNKGFEYVDDSASPPTITAVTLEGPDTVRIKLSAAPVGAGKTIRYAATGAVGARAGATTGPRGNLRDSDTSRSRDGDKLENWAVHFAIPVP
ncbi:MAG: hypothetical protein IPF92_24915 [Myxococcales bacterium]|nr:hypothetical protein [Myxococcales bacterium]